MAYSMILREVKSADLAYFWEYERDPKSREMAAFVRANPDDEIAFREHWQEIQDNQANTIRTIEVDGQVIGTVSSYPEDGRLEVTYWLGREYWNKGYATEALIRFVTQDVRTRPLYARVAHDNWASQRVLLKCGFRPFQQNHGYAESRGEVIEEYHLVLGQPNL